MSAKAAKPRLSKGILEMKFMQRTKAKVDKEIEEAEGRAMYSSEITERMINQSNSNFILEPSFIHCEGLIEGRLSFRGMNPEIERLLELEQAEREAAQRPEQKKDVSDKDMAAFYHAHQAPAATHAMQKKFQNKRKINNHNGNQNQSAQNGGVNDKSQMSGTPGQGKKKKFQKPREEDQY